MPPRRELLSAPEVAAALVQLPGWQAREGALVREFLFVDFVGAWGFMAQVALIAESLDHHPNWSNVYNRVSIDISTHDRGGITALDVEFARRVGAITG